MTRYVATTTDLMPDALIPPDGPGGLSEWVRVASCDAGLLTTLLGGAMAWAEGGMMCDQPLFERVYVVTLTSPMSGTLPGLAIRNVTVNRVVGGDSTPPEPASFFVVGSNVRFADDAPHGPYVITYTAGWNADTLPPDVRLALLYHVAFCYDNRANPVSERVTAAESILRRYKHFSL